MDHVKGCNQQQQSSSDQEETMGDLRRGPWTVEEDFTLINYIAHHGEGRWNSLARCAGLKRTGKSCRLRWLNYLRPDVRRGNITLEEQLLILELHCRWGNRWSKIAQHLPGRTDNEIKNYWRTRVQKHAKQLKCDVNSKQFKDTMRYLWMPRLVERIQAANSSSTTATRAPPPAANYHYSSNNHDNFNDVDMGGSGHVLVHHPQADFVNSQVHPTSFTPEYSSTAAAASSDSFGAQVSPVSDLTDCHNYQADYATYQQHNNQIMSSSSYGGDHHSFTSPTPSCYFMNQQAQGLDFQLNNQWDLDTLWNAEDVWFLHQQLDNN